MNNTASLTEAFSVLEPNEKAMFLARAAHMATVYARIAYAPDENYPERNYEHPDGVILRHANNFVHRVTGYMMHVLDRTEAEAQDASVMTMIAEHYRACRIERYLSQWLGISN